MSRRESYSAEEWHNVASNLQRSLGPEYLAQRPGPSGTKLTYIEGKTAINIANDIFGFNGWSTDIKETTIDFADMDNEERWSVGVSVTVRVTLKDGSYHEDVGYGHDQNAKSKGAAYEKARKQAVTDATKRTLRFFGNALGNCLYDNPYLSGIGKMAKPTIKFTPANLYRHTQFEQNAQVLPQAPILPKPVQQSAPVPQIQYSAAVGAGKQTVKTPYQTPVYKQQIPVAVKPQPSQRLKPIPAKCEPSSYPTSSSSSSIVAAAASPAVVATRTNGKAVTKEEEQIIDEKFSSLQEPIIPEDSFSYEGDDEFFAQLAAIDESDQPRSEDILPVDLSIVSSPNNTSAPGSENGNCLIRRTPPLSDLDKDSNKRTCIRN